MNCQRLETAQRTNEDAILVCKALFTCAESHSGLSMVSSNTHHDHGKDELRAHQVSILRKNGIPP